MISLLKKEGIGLKVMMPKLIPLIFSINFAVIWTCLALPETKFAQNFALITGAMLGIYIGAKNLKFSLNKSLIPTLMVLILFIWVLLHYLYIGRNQSLQFAELKGFWKTTLLGCIFAFGFGISMHETASRLSWRIVIIGMSGPTILYYIKLVATIATSKFEVNLPDYMILYGHTAKFYVPKLAYTFYCVPLLALSLGMLLADHISNGRFTKSWTNFFWVTAIVAVFSLFSIENSKNGILYSMLMVTIFVTVLVLRAIKNRSKSAFIWMALFFIGVTIFSFQALQKNISWDLYKADYEVALNATPSTIWIGNLRYNPQNQYGVEVNGSIFERVFYTKVGLNFLVERPLGYGLVQSSFGHIAKENWQYAPLIQTHSGWLDITLGLGVPGALLIFFAAILAVKNVATSLMPWNIFGVCVLGSIFLCFFTLEASQKNYLDIFIWMIVVVASLSLVKIRKS